MKLPRTTLSVIAALALAGAVMTAPSPAVAQIDEPGNHRNRWELELHLDANAAFYAYGTGWGAGARLNIPILPRGFIPSINNSVAIGVGADFVYDAQALYKSGSLEVPVVLQWNFHLSPAWTVFAEPGVFTSTLFTTDYCLHSGSDCNTFYIMVEMAVGARWHFVGPQGFPALVFRVGWPSGLSLGVSF